MKIPVSLSKITPPRFSHVLQRSRLIELLNQNREKKLILILGQAAQGKSTVALSWIDGSTEPVGWINLGHEEADPVNLYYLLVHSLQRALPGVDFSRLLGYPSVALGPREEIPLYQDWVQFLYDLLPAPVRLVLDNLDQVPLESAAYRFLQVLLDEAPPGLHFILLCREMPPLTIQTLIMRQEAMILTAEDLAFTLGETQEFLKVRRLKLPAQAVKQIHRLTEGWAGGLVLLCEGLEHLPEAAREEFLAGDLTEKFKGNVFRYFGEQVFAALPQSTKDFLVKSTILDVVDPDFIENFLGIENTGEILEDLVRRNLFIQPINDRKKGCLYRYHLLFRDFLYAKFQSQLSKEQQRALFLRAGELFELRGGQEEAARYYLQAQAYPQVISVIEKIGSELQELGKTAELSKWLQDVPISLVEANPWLLFFRYMSNRFTGSPDLIFDLLKAHALFEQQKIFRGRLLSLAYLLEAAITRGHPAIPPVNALLEVGEALLHDLPSQQYLPEKALLWLQIGFGHYTRGRDPRKGVWACKNAYLLSRSLGNIPLQINALTYGIGSLACIGEFARAEKMIRQAEGLLAKFPYPELYAMFRLHLSQLYWLQGDLTNLEKGLQQAWREIDHHGLTYLQFLVMFFDLSLKIQLGEFREADEIGAVLTDTTSGFGNQWLNGAALMQWGMARYFQGDYLKAEQLLQQAREVLSAPQGKADFHLTMIKITLGLVAYHRSGNGEAETSLREAINHTQEVDVWPFLKEAHLAMALIKWQQGKTQEAAAHLKIGMSIAQEHSYYHNLSLNRQDFLETCLLALNLGIEEMWDQVSHILATRLADVASPELEKLLYHPDKRVAERAWEIRRAIHRGGRPGVRIQTLGGFCLWRGETPLAEGDFEGHQPQLLLKAILARGTRGVVKDVLLEDLWPEADPEGAEKNFKVILHRLRKALEPDLDKSFGSSYVHLKANMVSLDPELCELDVEKFLSLIKKGARDEAQGQIKEAISHYKEAVASYGGDFLSEELYSPWAATEREELRETYLKLLSRLGGVYEKQGALSRAIDCYISLVSSDPLDEPACQRLMLLYAQKGRRSAALKVYQDCCLALKRDLNTEPDEVTTAVYQKILASP